MLKVLLVVMTFCLAWGRPTECHADRELFARIKSVTSVPIWRRPQRTKAELRQLLKGLQSTDKQTMRDAFEKLALSRPNPAYTDLVIKAALASKKRTEDKFASAMTFEISRDWKEAKKAAETLQLSRRKGGFRDLEQVVVQGNAAQAGGPMIAAACSGNARAVRLVTRYWRKTKIPGMRALLILGPPAAPELVKQLSTDNRFARIDIMKILGKIGTEQQIPQMEQAASQFDRALQRMMSDAIEEIKSRPAKESPPKKKGKQKRG